MVKYCFFHPILPDFWFRPEATKSEPKPEPVFCTIIFKLIIQHPSILPLLATTVHGFHFYAVETNRNFQSSLKSRLNRPVFIRIKASGIYIDFISPGIKRRAFNRNRPGECLRGYIFICDQRIPNPHLPICDQSLTLLHAPWWIKEKQPDKLIKVFSHSPPFFKAITTSL